MNKVQILGRVGQDPDIRTMQSGDKVANFSVAVTETWKDKTTGEKKEKTEWIPVVIFGKPAEIVQQYVIKGNRVLIEGAFTSRSWEQDGVTKYKTEVVVQGFKGSLTIIDWPNEGQIANKEAKHDAQADDMDDSDIPF